ncbi:DUF3558 domain-containing protein [Rhodococcus marinonascens]|uniref:DUF3558 domain-containing protein n=1 Tax=Rhodococcus marinonascens TaxID=38311 RepID=UPI000A03BDA6|nr:DUF3558 domain-containing protein [Rhodococcus marinonascens]
MMLRYRRSRAFAVAAIAAVSLLAGCGNSPAEEPVAQPVPRLTFHPCDGFGPDAQAVAGIDGKIPKRYEDREEPYQDWACSFRSDDPYFGVLVSSAAKLLSKTENDARLTLIDDTQIAGHRTLLHDFPGGLQCVASVDFDTAVLEIMVGYKQVGVDTADQACPLALKVAQDLGPHFPEHL